jgi:integrase
MAGRPRLRIGAHGKITRIDLGGGYWLARCRYRDLDGVARIVERRGPAADKRGLGAEEALIAALAGRQPPGGDEISLDALVMTLVDRHIDRLEEDGAALRTIDSYRDDAARLGRYLAGVRVGESTPPRLDAAIRSVRTAHGVTTARRARTVLRGGLQLAVMAGVLGSNPVRDLAPIKTKTTPQGAPALTGAQLRELVAAVQASEFCHSRDLADPIVLLVATGLRRSELLGLYWTDFDPKAATIAVTGKLIRQRGKGLVRVGEAKSKAGIRTIPLPAFAVDMLKKRRRKPYIGSQTMIFPSTAGTWRDPDNFNSQWRSAREDLGVADVTSHSFRKSLATLLDDAGLSARIGADHLGHAKVSMTQDRYMSRGRQHTQVADLLDQTILDE